MDIKLAPEQEAAAAALLADLQALNAAERDAYSDIVEDYQAIYADDREHQVLSQTHVCGECPSAGTNARLLAVSSSECCTTHK